MTQLFHPALRAALCDLPGPHFRDAVRTSKTLAAEAPDLTLAQMSGMSLDRRTTRADSADQVSDLKGLVRSRYGFTYSKEDYGYSISFCIPSRVSPSEFIDWASESTPSKFPTYKVIYDTSSLHGFISPSPQKQDRVVTLAVLINQAGHNKHEQLEALHKLDLRPASVEDLCLGAAIFRLAFGFPKTRAQIGTERDPGDLLSGYSARVNGRICFLMNDLAHPRRPAALDCVRDSDEEISGLGDIIIIGSPENMD